jgi:hypothetical protein
MKPTLGRIVHITLSADLAALINRKGLAGNPCQEDQVLPFIVTRIWSDDLVNGQLILDGPQNHWMTSVHQGTGPDQWHWPVVEPAVALVAESVAPINAASAELEDWRQRALFSEDARCTLGHEIEDLQRQLERSRERETHLLQERDRLIMQLEKERLNSEALRKKSEEQTNMLDELKGLFKHWGVMSERLCG